MKRAKAIRSILVCLLIATVSGAGSPMHAAEWPTVMIDDRDYVPLPEFAAIYGMKPSARRKDRREGGYIGEKHSLLVKIDSREAIVDGVRHWLSFPVRLHKNGKAHIALADIVSTVAPAFNPKLLPEVGKVKTVVFDPGHGGHDRGGRSPYGVEKDYTLDLVNRTRRILEGRGIKVVQSRLSDFFVELSERPAMTDNYVDPIFISIHFNSAGWKPSASGMEIYAIPPLGSPTTGKAADLIDRTTQPGHANEPESFVLANTIYHTLLGKTDGFDRGVKRSRFAVLRHAKVPAVLIECGFLTNSEEARKIDSSAWREKYAEALADGIMAYIAFANEGLQPPTAKELGREASDEFVLEE